METIIRFPQMTNTLQLIGCHFGVKPPAWTYPRHHHHFYELLYCEEGEIKQEIDGNSIRLEQGDWLFINAGARHLTRNQASSHYVYFNTHFDLDDLEIRKQLSITPYKIISRQEAVQTQLPKYMKELEGILQRSLLQGKIEEVIIDDTEVKEINLTFVDRINLQAHILLIISEFLYFQQAHPRPPSSMLGSSPYTLDLAHQIEDYLRQHLHTNVSIHEVAAKLHLSRYQCSRIFSKVYGLSPQQYVSRLKQNKAKELLLQTNHTIEDIAAELGFNSTSHFSRQFRRWTHQAPSQFRHKSSMTLEDKPTPND